LLAIAGRPTTGLAVLMICDDVPSGDSGIVSRGKPFSLLDRRPEALAGGRDERRLGRELGRLVVGAAAAGGSGGDDSPGARKVRAGNSCERN
jgi:hypothetical protein